MGYGDCPKLVKANFIFPRKFLESYNKFEVAELNYAADLIKTLVNLDFDSELPYQKFDIKNHPWFAASRYKTIILRIHNNQF